MATSKNAYGKKVILKQKKSHFRTAAVAYEHSKEPGQEELQRTARTTRVVIMHVLHLLMSSAMLTRALAETLNENMTVCSPTSRCAPGDCKTYSVPLDHCFAPRKLFPGDPQWGTDSILDHCNSTHLSRSFFAEEDTTCKVKIDGFVVPLGECIGPFGLPRPWGTFTCSPPSPSSR